MNTTRFSLASASIASSLLALPGCTSMSGLSGSSTYACKAPEGVTCASVSGTYANALQGHLPSQRAHAPKPASAVAGASTATSVPTGAAAQSLALADATAAIKPSPLRSSPRVLRLWIKPWEDADQDLHDQGYVYVQIDGGRWLVDHVQRRIRDAHAPLRPPAKYEPTTDAGDGPREAASTPRDRSQSPGFSSPTGRPNPTQ